MCLLTHQRSVRKHFLTVKTLSKGIEIFLLGSKTNVLVIHYLHVVREFRPADATVSQEKLECSPSLEAHIALVTELNVNI